ncbi:HlyD family secretion protein [uncultured Synechococcales cyanobacterium]|uniref:HlyD family secretion protein n=1 Tax=uncultured Synechococcales cyanobacterium TaxID=1936017 RepID=A0A6J4VSE8_9CYAN|nr:HlyD family secretion protein [uncultured Synechococcales cyanobacterium]
MKLFRRSEAVQASPVFSASHFRQTQAQFNYPADHLSYELGKAVQELPPLYSRLLAGGISLIVFSAIAWAGFSKVDEVAVASGKLVPVAQVRPVRSLKGGIIQAVKVKEGDRVQKGQVLVEGDATLPQTEVQRLENVARLIRKDIPRLEQARTQRAAAGTNLYNQRLASSSKEFIQLQAGAIAEANRQRAALDAAKVGLTRLQENLANAKENLANAKENLANAKENLANANTREKMLRALVANGAVPRLDYIDVQDRIVTTRDQIVSARDKGTSLLDKVVSLEKDIAVQNQEIRQAEQAYQAAQAAVARSRPQHQGEVLALQSEHQNEVVAQTNDQREILTQINQKRQELATIEGQLKQAKEQQNMEMIKAPASGTIYNVAATSGPVQPGEELLSILPDGKDFVLEVQLPNKDIGFITKGMRSKVKLSTFPFQEYGIIDATVSQISPSAINNKDLGLVFPTKIRLNKNAVMVNGKQVQLSAGMAGTAEIVTRQKSILTFLIEPVARQVGKAFSVR